MIHFDHFPFNQFKATGSFYTHRKYQEIRIFLMFSGCIERDSDMKRANNKHFNLKHVLV